MILETGENALWMNEWDYARFQANSWLLVHYLIDERRPAFAQLLHELARGIEAEELPCRQHMGRQWRLRGDDAAARPRQADATGMEMKLLGQIGAGDE